VSLEDVADFGMSGDGALMGTKNGEPGVSSKGISAPMDFNMSFAGRLGREPVSPGPISGQVKARGPHVRSRYEDDDEEEDDVGGGF
jgi:hypothetical protein